jgi:hypothetical protein
VSPHRVSRRSETGAGAQSKHGEGRSHQGTSIVRWGTIHLGDLKLRQKELPGHPPARSTSLMPGERIFKGFPPTLFLPRFGYPSAIALIRISIRVTLGNALVLVPEYQTGPPGTSQGTQAPRQKSHLALTGPAKSCWHDLNASTSGGGDVRMPQTTSVSVSVVGGTYPYCRTSYPAQCQPGSSS